MGTDEKKPSDPVGDIVRDHVFRSTAFHDLRRARILSPLDIDSRTTHTDCIWRDQYTRLWELVSRVVNV